MALGKHLIPSDGELAIITVYSCASILYNMYCIVVTVLRWLMTRKFC